MTMIRIAVLQFSHETVTFLPNDTTRDDFIYPGSPATGEALLGSGPKSYIGGFVKLAREFPGVELTGITSPLWPKTGSGSGWVTEDAFEHFLGVQLAELQAQGPFDGVYLSLHGAMAVRGVARPEAEIARRVRALVGPGCRIAGTFDPHGNEDDAYLRHADFGFCVKYFPHYDDYLQGMRAARMLIRAIRGDFAPAHHVVKVPIITPTVVQWTGASPWMDLVQRALTWEAREPDVYVNVFFGFPWADTVDAGMTMQVTTNGNPALAKRVADDMAGAAWRAREGLVSSTKILSMPDAVRLAATGEGRVVLADYSDRSGAATFLLRDIIAQDLPNVLVATVMDADLLARIANAQPGDDFDQMVGGRVDVSAGDPVRVVGTLRGVGKGWAAVDFGRGSVLVITDFLTQIIEPASLRTYGLDPGDFKVFAIKSRAHFRRGFDDSGFARTIMLVEPPAPFLGTTGLDALPFAHLRLADYYPYGSPKFP
jgi:microcystin degradation protein MlrC